MYTVQKSFSMEVISLSKSDCIQVRSTKSLRGSLLFKSALFAPHWTQVGKLWVHKECIKCFYSISGLSSWVTHMRNPRYCIKPAVYCWSSLEIRDCMLVRLMNVKNVWKCSSTNQVLTLGSTYWCNIPGLYKHRRDFYPNGFFLCIQCIHVRYHLNLRTVRTVV